MKDLPPFSPSYRLHPFIYLPHFFINQISPSPPPTTSTTLNSLLMVETHTSLQQINQPNYPLRFFFSTLDPMSLILSQNSDLNHPIPFQLTNDCPIMERGPRYRAYAELRESKLRKKNVRQEATDHESRLTPPKK